MPTRTRVCAWIAAWGLAVPPVAAAQDRTDSHVIDLIVRDGPQARAIRAQSEVIRREQLARLAYPNPAVTYSREGAGFTEFLQVEQSLPVFGTRAALAGAGVAATDVAEADVAAQLWALRTEAAAAVARLTFSHVRLDAAQAHTREVERLIGILHIREREGEGSRFDRLRAEQELRETRQLATSAAVEVAETGAAVTAMLPADVTTGRITRVISPGAAAPALDALLTRALSARAELRALRRSADRAEAESRAARTVRLPAPTLFGGLKRADDDAGRQRGGVFGVNLSVPLFDRGGREAARWQAERTRIEAERTSLERQIRGEITRAFEALALRQAALSGDAEESGEELMRIAEVAYREGEIGILELLDAVRTASRARLQSLDLRLDARLAQIALERAAGEILWP